MRGQTWACVVLAGVLLIAPSCGRKANPFLPQTRTTARVVDLKGAWQDGYIVLEGDIPDAPGADEMITGSRVQYGVYPVTDPPCDGCPVEYQGFYNYGPEVIRESQFFCRIPGAVRGNIYFFEAHLTGAKGVLGPPSNRAKVVVE